MNLKKLINRIEDSPNWILDDCQELCKAVGLWKEWREADCDSFEEVVNHAMQIAQDTIADECPITDEDIDDIMCSALEGGINYWCDCVEVCDSYLGKYASEQISRGGVLKLYDAEDNSEYLLDKEHFINGVRQAIKNKEFSDYDWYTGYGLDICQVDVEVADAIIQYAIFGEIMFG